MSEESEESKALKIGAAEQLGRQAGGGYYPEELYTKTVELQMLTQLDEIVHDLITKDPKLKHFLLVANPLQRTTRLTPHQQETMKVSLRAKTLYDEMLHKRGELKRNDLLKRDFLVTHIEYEIIPDASGWRLEKILETVRRLVFAGSQEGKKSKWKFW